MAGIYIHIPFCKQACTYCDFHFSTSLKSKTDLVNALVKELELRKDYLNDETIETVYFGGGTPSLLSKSELETLFNQVFKLFHIAPQPEITLEANPDDLTPDKLKDIRSTPVNRLSIGIQSFLDKDLQWMNRSHTAQQALDCVRRSQDAGITNVSIDLIYGLPGSTDIEWEDNLSTAFKLDVPHISSYCLTVEEKTKLGHLVRNKKVTQVNDETAARQFDILVRQMAENNFIHYEISNFCREGYYARHNSNYWKGVKYLGIGPSAHSFDGTSRQWNIASNATYISSIVKGIVPAEKEELTTKQRFNEYVMTSLRTIWGCDLEKITTDFGEDYQRTIMQSAAAFIDAGLIKKKNNVLTIEPKGKFIADRITSDLFIF